MYTKIFVPLDGSKVAEGILPYARHLSSALEIPCELLLAVEADSISSFCDLEVGRYFDTVAEGMKRDSLRYLENIAGSFADSGRVTCRFEIGSPADLIVNQASADRNALITMATHGRSGVQRWLLGSVADKVLHAATNPLLLVRSTKESEGGSEAKLKTVFVPLDGSELAETVLPHMMELARKLALEVILLRAYSQSSLPYFLGGEGYLPNVEQLRADISGDEARKYLENKTQQLQWQGLNEVSYLLLQGDPAAEIIDVARKCPDNFLAMCTHGRSGIGRWVLGSVADRVVRHSGDPVLIVRAPR